MQSSRAAPRPFVTAVFAQSLDGRIAVRAAGTANERTVFSTNEGSVHAHRARAAHDAVLVGIGTVVADDPRLTVRLCPCSETRGQPMRVVLDSALAIPDDARLLARTSEAAGAVVVLGGEGRADPAKLARLTARGVDACILPASSDGRVDLTCAMAALAHRGVGRLLVEGGAAVLTAFFRARLVDAVEIDIAPVFVGDGGLASVGDLGITALARGIRMADVSVTRLGENVAVRGRVVYATDARDNDREAPR